MYPFKQYVKTIMINLKSIILIQFNSDDKRNVMFKVKVSKNSYS